MRFATPIPLGALLKSCPNNLASLSIPGLSDSSHAQPGDLVCSFDLPQLQSLLNLPVSSQLSCIVGPPCDSVSLAISVPYIPVDRPRLAFQQIVSAISAIQRPPIIPNVHPTAIVHPLAILSTGVHIGPYTIIDAHAQIGKDTSIGSHCHIGSHVVLADHVQCDHHVVLHPHCSIGAHTTLQSHTTIGADGFGFERQGHCWSKIPHLSGVIIGSHCSIGSHVAIAAGVLHPTTLGNSVIVDNHVQIAHHVQIGDGTAIAGCAGIAGSAIIGKNCLIGGAATIAGHIKITDGVIITGMTMVTKSLLSPGIYSSGMPVDTNKSWKNKIISLNRLSKKEFSQSPPQ